MHFNDGRKECVRSPGGDDNCVNPSIHIIVIRLDANVDGERFLIK